MKRHRPHINNKDRNKKVPSPRHKEHRHHILPTSRGGTNTKENIINLFDPLHNAYHRLVGNATMPEQLYQLLKINNKTLTDEFKKDIYKILKETDMDYYYKKGIYIGK